MNCPAPVEISYENMYFLITHNPTNATLNKFTEELKKYGVMTLVRVCDATYDKAPVEKEGIHVLDCCFTWRNTDLRCNYTSEIPVGIAVFSREKCKRRLT
uniref:Protein tyrosine phosphatase 4A2 n=1 Tax=Theropithecus gelada TaxID=9565 RepID=A0A8D2ERC6_THEGE